MRFWTFNSILLCFLAGCRSLPTADFSPDEAHAKIVTYNVNWGFSRPQAVAEYLDRVDADVVFLQETHSDWEAFLTRQLRTRYPFTVFRDGWGAGGIAFLSKYPIENIQLVDSSAGWFPALYGEARLPIGVIQLLNVHLRPPLSDEGRATIYGLYRTPGIHSAEIRDYFHQVDLARPVIVAGDFNEEESGRAIQWVIGKGFVDGLSTYDRYTTTWQWVGGLLRRRYDHVLVNEHLDFSGARVDDVNASDHEPIVVVVLPKPEADKAGNI